jgi:hypothetical protein
MPAEEKMNIAERYKYLRMMQKRYEQASRRERGHLLDEMVAVTGLYRKHLIRLLSGDLVRQARQRQRSSTYGPAVTAAVAVVWESLDRICAERLTPSLAGMAQHLEAHGELQVSADLLRQLGQISIATVERRLQQLRQDQPRLPRPLAAGPALLQGIPMKRLPWDLSVPGSFEADLVHHCGPSAANDYVCTLQLIDVATGWSERVAVLGRSYRVMEDAFLRILRRLPFSVREIHPDNGSEFFNAHLLRFFGEKVKGARLSRSRPYHKNDNRFVEQKNSSLVRRYLGMARLDTVAQTLALNELYELMWVYYNLFQPVLHLCEKEFVPAAEDRPARIIRRHDEARTPFARLCTAKTLTPEQQAPLEVLRDQTNPRRLRQDIWARVDHLLDLPGAVPGQPEDIRRTLGVYTISQQGGGIPVALSLEGTTALR